MGLYDDPGKRAARKAELSKVFTQFQGKDEASLSDEELQQKLAALKEYTALPGDVDRAEIERALKTRLPAYGVKNNVDALAWEISHLAAENGKFPGSEELLNKYKKDVLYSKDANKPVEGPGKRGITEGVVGGGNNDNDVYVKKGWIDPNLENFFNDQDTHNYFADMIARQNKAGDFSSDVARIEGILNPRIEQKNKDTAYSGFLQTAPAELRGNRSAYYDTLANNNLQYLTTRAAPSIVQNLNARGLAESGDVGAQIAAEGTRLQGQTEGVIQNLEASDAQFFADAAYQLTLTRLNASEADYKNQIAFARAKADLQQRQNFDANQNQISRDFDQQILNRELERKSTQQNNDINFRKSQSDQAFQDALISDIGGAVGAGVGVAVAGPVGGVVGGSLGKTVADKAQGAPSLRETIG